MRRRNLLRQVLDGKAKVKPVKLQDTCISESFFEISDKHDINESLKPNETSKKFNSLQKTCRNFIVIEREITIDESFHTLFRCLKLNCHILIFKYVIKKCSLNFFLSSAMFRLRLLLKHKKTCSLLCFQRDQKKSLGRNGLIYTQNYWNKIKFCKASYKRKQNICYRTLHMT